MTTTHHRLPRVADLRRELGRRRAERAARAALVSELASYSSRRDLLELEAILARYSDPETADIRSVLGQRRAA